MFASLDNLVGRPVGAFLGQVKGRDKRALAFLALGVVVALIVVAGVLGSRFGPPGKETVGYPAIFVVNLLGSGGLVLPMPGLAFTAWGGLVLDPVLVALVAATAETLGEVSGYLLGYGGRAFVEKVPWFRRLERPMLTWLQRWGGLAIAVLAAIPNPAFDVLGVAAGGVKFPLWKFLAYVWPGKFAKTLVVAYLGAQGVGWILNL
jgi:membrane protein YqaA with SNARE-associated domain